MNGDLGFTAIVEIATLKIKLVLKLEHHADRKHGILGPGAFLKREATDWL